MVRSTNAPRNRVDQGGIPWPMLRNKVHPMMISAQGRYRRENNESLALATSSEYNGDSSPGAIISCSNAHLAHTRYLGPLPFANWSFG